MTELPPYVASLRLADHHCHGVIRRDLDRAGFEGLLTEAGPPGPLGGTLFDSRLGLALRRWCPPILDLPAHAAPGDYLARRNELGAAEVNRRFLRAAGIGTMCVDTGYTPEPLLEPRELGELAGARAYEVVRLEQVAEEVAARGPSAAGFAGAFRARLAERSAGAVGFKSIAAYRVGLALSGERPGAAEVTAAAGDWLKRIERGAPPRLADEVLHRFLIWCGVEHGLPIQFHAGYGDADLDLRRADPLLLTDLLRALRPTGTPVLLLHNYPFHREAGYLAQVFPHVFADVGLAVHNVGGRAAAVLAELMELAPFGKLLFSSDAYGLPELYYLAAVLFRHALAGILETGVATGDWTSTDAARLARLVTEDNARRVYRLES